MWGFLKNLGRKLSYDPAIPKETIPERDTCASMFFPALLTVARTEKQPRCPLTDEWIQKLWYIHTMECYSALKKECI